MKRKSTRGQSIEFHGPTLSEVEDEYKDWRGAYRDKYHVTKKHKPKRLNTDRASHHVKYSMLVEFEKAHPKPRR
jgi:hypothetical protein